MNIEQEIKQSQKKYGHFNSTHEVYGVLIEEVEEFFEVVRLPNHEQQNQFKTKRMIEELTQIASISLRAINELKENKIKWI